MERNVRVTIEVHQIGGVGVRIGDVVHRLVQNITVRLDYVPGNGVVAEHMFEENNVPTLDNCFCRDIVKLKHILSISVAHKETFFVVGIKLFSCLVRDMSVCAATPNTEVANVRAMVVQSFIWRHFQQEPFGRTPVSDKVSAT